ncbi:MAG TPA: tetratricopeptide repeat protein, partial [Pirellulaceae bacterium]|nr:tetratricopeptide repeat protein [Pirellulaceae bacterium]
MSRPKYRRLVIVAIISSVVTFVLAVGGSGAWYYRKSTRLQSLLDASRVAEEAQDWSTVEANLRSYVARGGDDPTVYFRIGRAIESGAINERDRLRAIPFYARSLAKQPNHLESRLRFAELQVTDNPPEAIKVADRILQGRPDHPDAWRIKALARLRIASRTEAAVDRLTEADEVVAKALTLAPGDLKLASQAADFYARHAAVIAKARRTSVEEVNEFARKTLDAAVEQAEDEAEARLARVLFRRRQASVVPGDAVISEDIQRLVELRPNSNSVRMLAAGWATGKALLSKTD